MLSTDISLDAGTAITAGTSLAQTYSLIGGASVEKTVRSVASTALSSPKELTIGHLQRRLKGFKTLANVSVPAPDVLIDRHTVRLQAHRGTADIYDPDCRITTVCQLTIEIPRVSPALTTIELADEIKKLVSFLLASSNANLIRIVNNES